MKWCGFTQLLIAKTVVPGSYRWLLVTYRDNLPGGGAVCMVLQCWQTQKHLLVEPPAVSRWSTEFLATEKYTATDIASTRSSTAANAVATVIQTFQLSTNFLRRVTIGCFTNSVVNTGHSLHYLLPPPTTASQHYNLRCTWTTDITKTHMPPHRRQLHHTLIVGL